MATTENLKPQNTRTKAEQREIARQGGIASGKARREKKMFRDLFLELLDETTVEQNGQEVVTRQAVAKKAVDFLTNKEKELDAKDYIKVMEFIRDTIGEKPVDRMAMTADIEAKNELAELLEQRKNNACK